MTSKKQQKLEEASKKAESNEGSDSESSSDEEMEDFDVNQVINWQNTS